MALTTDEEEGPARCLAAGFDDVLPKPLDPDRLPALLGYVPYVRPGYLYGP